MRTGEEAEQQLPLLLALIASTFGRNSLPPDADEIGGGNKLVLIFGCRALGSFFFISPFAACQAALSPVFARRIRHAEH